MAERKHDFTFAVADPEKSKALADRVRELCLVDEQVEEAEGPWRQQLIEDRLRLLQQHVTSGRLLEIGCATGEFLFRAKAAGFEVHGIEPEPSTSALARENYRLDVITATLSDVHYAAATFDAVVLFHVLEHLDSPRKTVAEIHRILTPGGRVAIETPSIDTIWFRILRSRWRQFIPDHYSFFTPATLKRLLDTEGFTVLAVKKIGKPMSVRLFLDRIRRLNTMLGRILNLVARALQLHDRTLRLNLGDVMIVIATKRE